MENNTSNYLKKQIKQNREDLVVALIKYNNIFTHIEHSNVTPSNILNKSISDLEKDLNYIKNMRYESIENK